MNTELKKNVKNHFKKEFFKFIKETMENVRKHRDIKLATTKTRRNYLVSKPNFNTTESYNKNFFSRYLLATEMKKKHK